MTGPIAPELVVLAVVAVRLLVPLLIPRYPLPGIAASILIDAADQSIFQALLGTDLPRYQPYDKALDVYSLSITMLAVLRNWESRPAVAIARGLFYLRLLGVFLFELTGWRPLLVILPNTFEYFFIFYELVRAWWSPARLGTRALLTAAGGIWLGLKIPQEYFLHVARLSLTDLITANLLRAPATGGTDLASRLLSVMLVSAVILAVILVGRALAPRPQHPTRLVAGPLPRSIDEVDEWASHVARTWRVLDRHLVEKIVLVGTLTVIFAQIVPGIGAGPVALVGGVAVLATLNSLLLLRWARKGRHFPSAAMAVLVVALLNGAFVLAAALMLRSPYGGLSVPASALALLLLSLIVTLYDRWRPVSDVRLGVF